ncbi:hypothetical protein GWN75_11055 [candidate division KSB1 bacterium]|nr:hypothetical protein [candidate division KSB1 bacterium]
MVQALTNFRAEHPDFANGEISNILEDTNEWLAFEKQGGDQRFLVLINPSAESKEYEADVYQNARLLFWSDGSRKQWENYLSESKRVEGSVSVPAFGLIILERA